MSSHAGWSDQKYGYDATGRLISVEDTTNTVCTRRTYVFDNRTNRTSLTSASGTPGTDCPTTGGATTNYSYDSASRITNAGYVYDAFGRTTAMSGSTVGYYANDRVYQQTANGKRQTWQLDSAMRIRSWTVETGSGANWAQTAAKINHYSEDGDSPSWIAESSGAGAVTRSVGALSGNLSATTSASADVVLQFTNIHDDVALQLPLDSAMAPTVIDADEYGNEKTAAAARYGWLGGKQRSSETLTGLVLMGARLYNPGTGRFLSADPIYGGSLNAYEYAAGNPITNVDLDGQAYYSKTRYYSWGRLAFRMWWPGWGRSGWGYAYGVWTMSRRWTQRIADYGWYPYTVLGAVAAFGGPVGARLAATAAIYLGTMQLVAANAKNRGQCLQMQYGFAFYHFWWSPVVINYKTKTYHWYWRGRC